MLTALPRPQGVFGSFSTCEDAKERVNRVRLCGVFPPGRMWWEPDTDHMREGIETVFMLVMLGGCSELKWLPDKSTMTSKVYLLAASRRELHQIPRHLFLPNSSFMQFFDSFLK